MPLSRLKLPWAVALFALPLGAQSDAPVRTISAELLRYQVSEKALHMLQKAVRASQAGDHAGAIQELQETVAKHPNTGAYVYSLEGVEYLKTGQLSEAVTALEQAVLFLPHDASNHANLGLALACEGKYDRARSELERALDLDPHNAVASRLLAAPPLKTEQIEVARQQ